MATKKTNQIGHTIYADNIVLTKPAKSSRAVTTLDVNTNLVIIDKDNLMEEVEKLSSDKYLTVSEKQGLLREYEAINSRHLNVVVEALEIGMGDSPIYTDYLASHSDLVNMLDLILADMSKGSDITAITNFTSLFSDYYTKIQVLNDKFFAYNTGYIDGIDKRTKLSATILSSKGDSIGDDPTTLSVVIMNDNINVTTSFFPESYRWERMTNDINGDGVWNEENSLTGYSINVSVDDLVGGVASFLCIFNHQVSELVTYKKTAAITINKLLEGPAGEKGDTGDSGTSAIIEYSVGLSNINHPKIREPIGYAGKGIGYLRKLIGCEFLWDTIAPEVPEGSFLWQRQRVGLLSKWSYSCLTGTQGIQGPQGIQGAPGIPGKLGLSAVGPTLYLKGFNADGSFGANTGLINFNDAQLTIPEAEYTFEEVGPGYIILDTTLSTIVPKFVKMVAVASTTSTSYVSWRDFNTGTEIAVSSNTNFIIIGIFHVEVDLIDASEIINPVLLNTFTKSHFMDLLNDRQTVTSDNFGLWAKAMGVTDVFASLAAYELFVDKLTANEGFIENLGATNIKIDEGGSIYSGYSADGKTPPSSGSGFWLGTTRINGIYYGKLKAYFAELLGTLRTGLNAPTDARVAVQDEAGITSGPTFTGSGLNDLNITNEGDVAGKFRVKISGINNATNSGKEGYWATPISVGTNNWKDVAVNSAGKFVAVGTGGYVSYSDDGITWETPFQVGTNSWYAIAVNSSGRFVAVGYKGAVSYSNDGITWATPFTIGTDYWIALGIAVNSSGRFVAVGNNCYVSYSNDGITWVTPFKVGDGSYWWQSVAVNSAGRFVAVGEAAYVSYSSDGITWATRFRVGTDYWQSVAVNSSGRFVAVGNYGNVSYSDDGITWATPFRVGLSTTIWNGVTVNSSGRFVAVGNYGRISYSDDGITWATPLQFDDILWNDVTVNSSGKFVAVGDSRYIMTSLLQDTIQISSNGGTTWGSGTLIPSGGAISITGFGIDISFGHTEGHTVGNYWSFTQGAMRGLVITDSAGDEYFSASSGVIKQNGMPAYACRAWVNFNGYSNVGGYCIIRGSENVSSVVDNGVGDYTVNFSVPMPDANYSAVVSSSQLLNTDTQEPTEGHGKPTTLTPSSCRVITMFHVQNIAHNMHDCELICLSIFR